jgi:hypothetical protein
MQDCCRCTDQLSAELAVSRVASGLWCAYNRVQSLNMLYDKLQRPAALRPPPRSMQALVTAQQTASPPSACSRICVHHARVSSALRSAWCPAAQDAVVKGVPHQCHHRCFRNDVPGIRTGLRLCCKSLAGPKSSHAR